MVARKLVSTCRYIVQTVTQSGIRASVFLWAGNVKGGEERGLASTRISSSMRESQDSPETGDKTPYFSEFLESSGFFQATARRVPPVRRSLTSTFPVPVPVPCTVP